MQVRPAALKSLWFGCCLAWEMSCRVWLNFEHRQPCHCYFSKGVAGVEVDVHSTGQWKSAGLTHVPSSGGCCELVPGSLWWLRHCVTTALQELSLPPNLPEHTPSFYPLWGTSFLFRSTFVFFMLVTIKFLALSEDSLWCVAVCTISLETLSFLVHRAEELLKTASVEIHSCINQTQDCNTNWERSLE